MIESVFITLIALAFVLFILGIEKDNIVYKGLNMILWITLMVQATWIQVPGIDEYMELGFSAFCMAFIFIDIILLILHFMDLGWIRKHSQRQWRG